eukprot:Pgem_evm1s229
MWKSQVGATKINAAVATADDSDDDWDSEPVFDDEKTTRFAGAQLDMDSLRHGVKTGDEVDISIKPTIATKPKPGAYKPATQAKRPPAAA